jgi:hypothetical protein
MDFISTPFGIVCFFILLFHGGEYCMGGIYQHDRENDGEKQVVGTNEAWYLIYPLFQL